MEEVTAGPDRLTRQQALRTAGAFAGAAILGSSFGPLADSAAAAVDSARAGEAPRKGGTLHLALTDTSASETLDPANPAYGSQFVLFGLLYNRLISADYLTWALHPELAESWEASKDLRRYQIKLRKGVEFHNGKPLTSADVIWSLKRILDPKVGSSAYDRATMSMTTAGLKAVDKHTVELRLTRPDSQLPHLLSRAQLVIVPEGAHKFAVKTSIGTGPFKLDSWQAATSWSVSANKSYWEPGLPYLDSIQQVITTDSAARVDGVKSRQFDLAEEIEFSAAKTIQGRSDIKLFAFPKGISRLVVMDCSKKPFTDVRVREAFKYAMDRDLAVKSVYAGFAKPTTDLLLPPDDPFYPKGLGVRPYDPEKAKHLLASAGYKDGLTMPIRASSVYSGFSSLAQAYSQSAAAAGIKANVQLSAPATYFDQVWLKAPLYMTYWATFFPPDPLWYFYAPKAAYNEAHIKLPQVTAAFNGVMSTTNRAKQISLVQSVLSTLAQDWGHIVPANAQSPWVGSPKLAGVVGDPPAFRVKLTRAYFTS